jgi:adenylate cyclase
MSDRRESAPETPLRGMDASAEPTATEVRAELERILLSRTFSRAGRASDLLKFLVGETLAGTGARLKGYTVGVEVFGRPADFDPQTDPLVRVEAGRLRRRLIAYYSDEGSGNPVRVELPRGSYSVAFHYAGDVGLEALPGTAAGSAARAREWKWRFVAAALLVAFVTALGVIGWQQRALLEAQRGLDVLGAPQRTEWPRIVVVPFENLTDDTRLGRLAASMTEEVMIVLDQLDLFVVAIQTSWYGPDSGTGSLNAAATGGYVLTGSVRDGPEHARITVRLIEAESGTQIWSAAYDEPPAVEGLPQLQELVARDVAAAAAPYGPIFEAELARTRRSQRTPALRDCLVEYYDYRRSIDAAAHRDALLCFESVSQREPHVARVWSAAAMLHLDAYGFRYGREAGKSLEAARSATAEALAIDRDDPQATLALARLQYFDGDPAFRDSLERALSLRPDSAEILAHGGVLLVLSGDSPTGLPLLEQAKKRSKSLVGTYYFGQAVADLRAGQLDDALTAAQQIDAPTWVVAHLMVAAAAGLSGKDQVARAAARRVLELDPEFETEVLGDIERWRFDPEYAGQLLTGLRAAGLAIPDRGR